jgi:putative CocE/NonD family hydrolase
MRHADITGKSLRMAAAKVARAGYAVATINFRGTHESEGRFISFRSLGWGEIKDGYDVCEWLAVQSWSSGKVGSFGGSQGGYAQNYLVVAQPPHLVCQYVVDTGLSFFHDGYRVGGVTRPAKYRAQGEASGSAADNEILLAERDSHPNYDDFWRAEDASLHFAKMNVPCLTIGSWYDFLVHGSVRNFIGRQHHGGPQSRGRQQLVLGPWEHGRLNKSNTVGELVYPENAILAEHEHMLRWFDYWLKGVDTGIMNEPPVRYYVMGAAGEAGAPGNLWREARNWPPPATETRMYFHDAGKLRTTPPGEKEARTTFHSDPRQPMSLPARRLLAAQDARAFESQKDVRTWTTDTLTEPVEWTGEVNAEIWLSSTAPDTDLIVRLSDVYPDGRSLLLMEYPIRARYRDGFERESLLTPGKPALLRSHIGWTSLIFNRGHRIRVTLSSTGAPLFEPNNQTGGAQTADWLKEARAADNSIWHDATRLSCLVVPVMKAQPD